MPKQSTLANAAIAVAGVGLIAILFGTLWMTVIFPRFERVPTTLERIVELEGTYTVVDPFIGSLQDNQTIRQLLASDGAINLLGNPEVAALLSSEATAKVVSDPELLGAIRDPGTLQALASPAVASLLGNADLLQALSDPSVLAALADPANLPALLAHPVIGPLLADPTIATMLTDPDVLALLNSGLVAKLVGDPEVLALLQNPALGRLLSNPAVQALLADPAALGMLLDPRTQRVMANAADLPVVDVPVLLHRERRATGADGDRLFLNETVVTTNLATGADLDGFEPTDVDLVVHRETKAYLEGTEGGRTGHWALPFHVDKTAVYDAYLSVARQPLPARYDGTEQIDGLETYRFVIDSKDVPLGADDPATSLPLVVDAAVIAWVEPITGAGVNAVDREAIYAVDPAGNRYPRFVADIAYTDATVARLVDEARGDRGDIVFFGTVMPWIITAVGIVFVIGGAGAFVWDRRRRASATVPTTSL